MAFIKAKVDKSAVKESTGGGGAYLSKSGIYDVLIERASVSKSKNGATSVDFTLINEAGNSSTFYNNFILTTEGNDTDKNGKMLPGMALLNKIMIIHGIEELDDPVETEITVGKDNKKVELEILEDLADLPLKAQIQEEYSMYNDEIQRRLVIRTVFRHEDGASAEEIFADAEGEEVQFGAQHSVIAEKYADKITYRDGLTAEDIEAWKAANAEGNNSAPKTKSTGKVVNKKAGSLFKK